MPAKKPARPAKKAARPARKPRRPPDPTALTVAQLAKAIGVDPALVQADVDAGAPAAVAGKKGRRRRINLIHYLAWVEAQDGQAAQPPPEHHGEPGPRPKT